MTCGFNCARAAFLNLPRLLGHPLRSAIEQLLKRRLLLSIEGESELFLSSCSCN